MTLSTLTRERKAPPACTCSLSGPDMIPYFSANAVISQNAINQLISESFLTVKGAALFLPRGNGSSTPRISHRRNKHAGDLQQHLQAMFILLRPEDNIRLVSLTIITLLLLHPRARNKSNRKEDDSMTGLAGSMASPRGYTRETQHRGPLNGLRTGVLYRFLSCSSTCTMGLVLPLWSDTLIHLDGDGGFSVSTDNRVHIFKPVSVQAMWSALQSLHKACEVARMHNYYPGSLFLTWVSYYESHINSDQSSVNEWNAMQDVQSHRPDSPVLFTDIPTERERTERLIKTKLREIMMQKDLENITSKEIRTELEMQMVCNLREFKEFIDNEMIVILGQMDSPTQIFEHVFLGSEWNASNLEDLQNRGVRYILNVTREIDNFFPGVFEYHNIRVYDEEATDLLAYWNDTYKFISKAKKHGSKCLVHCKMGVSRSASTVIAYAMKEYGWNLDRAYDYVKERRTVTKPNPSFMRQLEEYQGILLASKQRHNKLWRSHSDSDLSDHHEPICKAGLDLNKKEITTSADQIAEVKTMESHPPIPPVFVEHVVPQDTTQKGLCATERMICLEFTSREFRAEQLEDELNLNDINGYPSGCCLKESKLPLDNCHAAKTFIPAGQAPEMTNDFPDLEVEDLEADALRADMNVHLLPMEDLTSRLKDLPMSPDPGSPSPQPAGQAQVSDFSTDRIDFFSALEKFVELSQETRSQSFSHSRTEESGGGRSESCRMSVTEVTPSEVAADDQRSSSLSNTPQASEDSSMDEEQAKAVSELVSPDSFVPSHTENAVSVKGIITEIESISQGMGQIPPKGDALPNPCHTPKKNATQELPVERAHAPDSKPGGPEQHEGPELAKDARKWDPEGCLATRSFAPDVEEEELAEGEPELRGPGMHPGAKWYPGSVRRATLEFEERLRQEQEQHGAAPGSTSSSTRKNSKNEALVADLAPKGKSDEAAPELSVAPKESGMSQARGECGAPEAASGPLANQKASAPPSQPLPALRECPGSNARVQQEGDLTEQGPEHPCPAPETQAVPLTLPKRIEIIEYTHPVTSPDHPAPGDDRASPEKSGPDPGLRKVTVEKPFPMLCALDENLNRTLCPHQLPLRPKVLPLPHASSPEHCRPPSLASTLSSPEDRSGSPATPQETASPLASHTTHVLPADLDSPQSQTVVHLEGSTEQSSSTDPEPSTWQDSWEQSQGGPLCRATKVPHTGSRLNNNNLSLMSDVGDPPEELQEKLGPSPRAAWLSHSSSSDNLKSLSHSAAGVVKERAKAIESRVTCRPGLITPSSHMRRSASLAKLGYLDLCKDCFSEREPGSSGSPRLKRLQPCTRTHSGTHAVEAQDPPESPEPTKYSLDQLKTAECVAQSKPVERPLVQYAKEFGYSQQCALPGAGPGLTSSEGGLPWLQTQGPQGAGPAPVPPVAPRQQHGRTHPLRRLRKANDKKRTTNPFYNTM
ncbi:protein phosphatase Slingshot homolog 2 [Echinops telfairi]|uniref:Protein phosphatase Slingshot homolog 2 n=1 Tax=Echinops telfairi TaxID=9371 RepID=A0AC55DVY3_ECHTE|nr:protein phosphatase Slingshot homolog 2 [Echinops telfairi]